MVREMKIEIEPYDSLRLIVKDARNDAGLQIRQIDSLIKQKVDLIIISPLTGDKLTDITTKAYEAGIPTIVTDRKVEGDKYDCFIGADNYEIGYNAGSYIAENAPSGCNLLEIWGMRSTSPAIERNKGFRDAIKFRKDIRIHSIDGDWLYETAKQALKKDTLLPVTDVIYSHNDMMAIAAYETLQNIPQAKKHKVKIIGVDATVGAGLNAVVRGKINVSFLYPTGAYEIVQTTLRLLGHKSVPKHIRLKTFTINKQVANSLLNQATVTYRYEDRIEWQKRHLQNLYSRFYYLRNTTTIIIFLFIVVALLLLYVWRTNTRINLANRTLSEKNKREEEQNGKLIKLNSQIEQVTAQKLQFFTNISHEIRTPLTLIIGPLDRLQRLASKEEYLKDIKLIRKNAMRLLRMVNQILDFRKLDRNRQEMNIEEIDLEQFIPEVMLYFHNSALLKNINLKFTCNDHHLKIWADKDLLEKIIVNILSNSLKYTLQNGNINITVTDNADRVKVDISDTGIGISEDSLPHLFDRFYTGNTSLRDSTGIGMFLVREYMLMHGGEVAADSKLGKGTVIHLSFRKGREHFSGKNVHETDTASCAYIENVIEDHTGEALLSEKYPYTILVVEDDADMLEYINEELCKNFHVLTASNGAQALEVLNGDEDVSLILSDVMMPEMNGFELSRNVKGNMDTSHIFVILLTALNNLSQQIYGVAGGADEYICKPFNMEYLRLKIIRLLDSRKKYRDKIIKRLTELDRQTTQEEKIETLDDVFMKKVLAIIEKNYTDPDYNVAKISESINMSRGHFYRKVKQLSGIPPVDLLRTFRLGKASEMLKDPKVNINEVAYSVGFTSPAYFSKCFKATYGETPTEFVAIHVKI
jgi:signal transduction histidine kinase/AraC-like DNA-binding protein